LLQRFDITFGLAAGNVDWVRAVDGADFQGVILFRAEMAGRAVALGEGKFELLYILIGPGLRDIGTKGLRRNGNGC